jgi:hypothetical protein
VDFFALAAQLPIIPTLFLLANYAIGNEARKELFLLGKSKLAVQNGKQISSLSC